jgi:transposase
VSRLCYKDFEQQSQPALRKKEEGIGEEIFTGKLIMAMKNGENQEPQFAAFLAIDWADQKHVWSLQSADSTIREQGEVEQTPEAIEAWVAQMRQRFGHRPIAVAVEQTRGALVFLLSKYEQLHIFPVPPAMTANLRKAFFSSGAKDDPKDSDLLLDIVLLHREKLRPLSPDTEATRLIQNLVEERRKLVDEKTAQSNRLGAHLKIYFPQIPRLFDDVGSPLVCDLLERWPTLEELQKVRPADLRKFFRQHRCRQESIESRVQAIGSALPALGDRAVVKAKVQAVKVTVQLIQILHQGIKALDRQIQEAAEEHPDFFIFNSLPGAGAVMAPRLLAAFGTQRERYENAEEIQTWSGIAPVLAKSGKQQWVHFRYACPKFLRQTFHEWADYSMAKSEWARDYYQLQRRRGKKHHAAVRALAFKWIRILYRCWKDRVAYDESIYLAALEKRKSPLAAAAMAAPAGL